MGRVLFTLQHLIIDYSATPASLLRKALDASAARLISGSVMSLRLLSIAVPSPARGVWTRLGGEYGVFSLDGLSNPPPVHTGTRGTRRARQNKRSRFAGSCRRTFVTANPVSHKGDHSTAPQSTGKKARNMRARCFLTFDEDAQSLHGQPGNL